jgi:AmmeMemoRadiSam system protein A
VIGSADPAAIAGDLAPLLDHRTLLVISSDLSHYLPYDQAVRVDEETMEWILRLETAKLLSHRNRACGVLPIAVGLELANRFGWEPVLLHYSNSGDTAGDRDRVVGYAAVAFFGEAMTEISKPFDESQGRTLVELARHTLERRFGRSDSEEPLEDRLSEPCYDVSRGTFVTLKLDGQLRGCIGTLSGEEPVRENVKRNAVNAAFRDPRFPPLNEAELDRVQIEVSVLTEPLPLPYAGAVDLAAKLRPGVDGVIIRKGPAQATFLPQVWEQLPEAESFLGHLCRKAGLSADAWRDGNVEVFTYQVQYFEEPR